MRIIGYSTTRKIGLAIRLICLRAVKISLHARKAADPRPAVQHQAIDRPEYLRDQPA